MDWRDCKRLEVSFDSTATHADSTEESGGRSIIKRAVDITCTPCQHFTGRAPWDLFKSLWASWAIEEVIADDDGLGGKADRPPVKVYFAGDTAYRTVLDGEDEDEVPVCPAFGEIGRTFGGFDFAMIPIGCV
jgi:N-acyl-phosphatidylethanolamine-hydrolysing phospholipase D